MNATSALHQLQQDTAQASDSLQGGKRFVAVALLLDFLLAGLLLYLDALGPAW